MARREDARRFEKRGTRLLESADVDGAVEAFLEAMHADPSSVAAHVGLARAREAQGRLTLGVDAWRKVRQLAPTHAESALALAEALRQVGCYHLALTAYDDATELSDVPAYALAGKAETLRMLDHVDAALALFDTAVEMAPEHAFAMRGRASCLNARGRWAEALACWDRALELEPDSDFADEGRREAEAGLASGADATDAATPVPLDGVHSEVVSAAQWATALAGDGRSDEAIDVLVRTRDAHPDAARVAEELARLLEDEGRWDEALASHERRRRLLPRSGEAACDHADALRRSGRYAKALRVYEEATALGAGLTGEAGRAETLRMLRRHDTALDAFDRVLVAAPDMAFALRGKAATLDAVGQHEAALPLWTRAVELEPDAAFGRAGLEQCRLALGDERETLPSAAAKARRAHAVYLLDDGRPHEAAALLHRITTDAPRWSIAWHDLGRAYLADRQYKQALEALERARALDPEDLEIGLHHAEALRKHSDHRAAIRAYDTLLERDPRQPRALAGRGEALRMLGQYDVALDWFDRALVEQADLFDATVGKAACLNALRRHAEALPLWTTAARQRPDAAFVKRGLAQCRAAIDSDGVPVRTVRRRRAADAPSRRDRARAQEHLEKGRGHYKKRNYAAAARFFRRALDADPMFAEAALRLGMALEDDSRFQEAVSAYERCLRIDPKNYQAATNIGEAHRKAEKYDDAIGAYDRALELMPDYLYALAGRAECMRMRGDYKGSLVWFDKALRVGPRHAFAVQGKAAALNALTRFREALTLWDRALEIEPHSAFAREGKAFCEARLKSGDTDDASPAEDDSPTPTLDAQGRDLTALARAGKLPLVVGRQKEIRAVLKTLVRRLKANPLLLGDPGVGKTAVVEGVANILASDQAPERLKHLRVIELSIGSLVAGTKYRGTFEERLKEIIREARDNPGIVLFIDEIHTLVGAGRTEGGSLDAANILKPALARGEITVIGATTLAEYRKHFESDSALDRRFQPVTIDEPTEEACVELLAKVVDAYEAHHGVRVEPESLRACVRLGVRFVPERRLPDKALDLLDEACADASLSGEGTVDAQTVAQVVSDRTGVPVHQLTSAERDRLRELESALAGRVVGQPTAVTRVAGAVRLARSGLRDPRRPRGVFLFVGASGVGKTELARALADFLFPEGDALIKLDMSEYGERFTASRLLGAPPGYTGHGEEGQLTGPLRNRPYAVVLLDEFEKAHADVQAVFLSLFDEGTLTDSEGRKVHAREAYFVLTTNAGAQDVDRGRVGFGGDDASAHESRVTERVRERFRPELLNRVDDIVVFRQLDAADLEDVVRIHLHKLEERAAEVGITLTCDPAVITHLATCRSDDAWGARPALRAIQDLVAEPLGRMVVEADGEHARGVRAELRDGDVVLIVQTPARGQQAAPGAQAAQS